MLNHEDKPLSHPPLQDPSTATGPGPAAGVRPPVDPGLACCSPALGLWGWSPPLLAADTPLKRWADRVLPRSGLPIFLYFAIVAALLNLAPHLPLRGALAVDGLAALLGGGWCSLNFWRCRHAHCLVTGGGWSLLALFAFAEAGIGRTYIGGNEGLALLGLLAAGLLFEAAWSWMVGSNAVLAPTQARRLTGTRRSSLTS
jgi:hypothetical protein